MKDLFPREYNLCQESVIAYRSVITEYALPDSGERMALPESLAFKQVYFRERVLIRGGMQFGRENKGVHGRGI